VSRRGNEKVAVLARERAHLHVREEHERLPRVEARHQHSGERGTVERLDGGGDGRCVEGSALEVGGLLLEQRRAAHTPEAGDGAADLLVERVHDVDREVGVRAHVVVELLGGEAEGREVGEAVRGGVGGHLVQQRAGRRATWLATVVGNT
jgi:hypothetical protein